MTPQKGDVLENKLALQEDFVLEIIVFQDFLINQNLPYNKESNN